MTEDLNSLVGTATSEQSSQAVAEFLQWLLGICMKLINDAIALFTQNLLWVVVILVLMKVADMLIDHFRVPFPKGIVRWVCLFFILMAVSSFWISIFSGLIGG